MRTNMYQPWVRVLLTSYYHYESISLRVALSLSLWACVRPKNCHLDLQFHLTIGLLSLHNSHGPNSNSKGRSFTKKNIGQLLQRVKETPTQNSGFRREYFGHACLQTLEPACLVATCQNPHVCWQMPIFVALNLA